LRALIASLHRNRDGLIVARAGNGRDRDRRCYQQNTAGNPG
jgi:hypothetical protein